MRALVVAFPLALSAISAACVDQDALRHHMLDECATSFAVPGPCAAKGADSEQMTFAFNYEATLHVGPAEADCIMKVPCETVDEKRNAFRPISACLHEPTTATDCRSACDDTLETCGDTCDDDGAVLSCMNDYESCLGLCG